mmetsp:Transcript_35010/g.99239  ORF Transcript_35010/g.99239 Transcript_35010/m.99239 type:complete len:314 (-) Transcript_35010:97-1038(-)
MLEVGGTLEQPRVRVRIEVQETPCAPKLKEVTNGYEVYEVDGFIFKRRRKNPPEPPPVAQAITQTEPENAEDTAQPPPDNQETQLAVRNPPEEALETLFVPTTAEGIVKLCEQVSSQVIQEKASSLGEEAARMVSAAVQSWLSGLPGCITALAEPRHGERAPRPPAAAGLDDNQMKKSLLRTYLAKYLEEEREWLELEQQISSGLLQDSCGKAGALDGMDGAFTVDKQTKAVQEKLASVSQAAHQTLALQVEAYSGLVGGVEVLLQKAEQTCAVMQAEYHQRKFQGYPHVNSPAALIKGLARRGPPAAQSDAA